MYTVPTRQTPFWIPVWLATPYLLYYGISYASPSDRVWQIVMSVRRSAWPPVDTPAWDSDMAPILLYLFLSYRSHHIRTFLEPSRSEALSRRRPMPWPLRGGRRS